MESVTLHPSDKTFPSRCKYENTTHKSRALKLYEGQISYQPVKATMPLLLPDQRISSVKHSSPKPLKDKRDKYI